MRALLLAALSLGLLLPLPAHAAKRHHRYRDAASSSASAIGGRPDGCPARAWCGCWLGHHLGMVRRELWLAINWVKVGTASHGPQPGAIVVWRHHVGQITAVEPGRIKVISGNDGRAVRERWRSLSGVVAYRML